MAAPDVDVTIRTSSLDQLRQMRKRLSEQHELELAEADEAEETARRKRSRQKETSAIIEGLDRIEGNLVKEANVPSEPLRIGVVTGGTYRHEI